jgi:hypothetical protein
VDDNTPLLWYEGRFLLWRGPGLTQRQALDVSCHSLYRSAFETGREGIPLDHLASFVIAQAIAAWTSQRNLIRERAKRATGEGWERLRQHIPDVPPIPGDEPPENLEPLSGEALVAAAQKGLQEFKKIRVSTYLG